MTEFTTQKGKVIHVVHQSVTVACAWASETPRKPRYAFSWEKGSRPITPTTFEDSEQWHSGTDSYNQPNMDDSGILELADYPDEEADRLYREEYEEQLKPD